MIIFAAFFAQASATDKLTERALKALLGNADLDTTTLFKAPAVAQTVPMYSPVTAQIVQQLPQRTATNMGPLFQFADSKPQMIGQLAEKETPGEKYFRLIREGTPPNPAKGPQGPAPKIKGKDSLEALKEIKKVDKFQGYSIADRLKELEEANAANCFYKGCGSEIAKAFAAQSLDVVNVPVVFLISVLVGSGITFAVRRFRYSTSSMAEAEEAFMA